MAQPRTRTIAVFAISGMLLAGCGQSSSDPAAFPEDDINMIITYAAGGQTDAAGRAVANAMEEKLGVTVVVENVAGASGSVGTAQIAQADPDGYTIGMTTTSAVTRVPLLQETGYTSEDVQPLALAVEGDALILVRDDSPYETAEELFEAAEEEPDSISVGTAGAQTPHHVELQRLSMDHGISFRVVPHEGDAPNLTALVGGNQDVAFTTNADITMEYIEEGEIRPLAVTRAERTDYLPDVPTLSELGFEDLVNGGSNYIITGPSGMEPELVEKYESTLEEVLSEPDVVELIGENKVPTEFVGAEAVTQQMAEEQEAVTPIYEQLGE